MRVCHECKDLRCEIESLKNELETERKRAAEAAEVISRIQKHMVDNEQSLNVRVLNSDTVVFFFSDELDGWSFWHLAEQIGQTGEVKDA